MKKLVTLLAAAGMVVAASAPANAVDVKVDARYRTSFGLMQNFAGQNEETINHRMRLGLTMAASENLSAYVQFQLNHGNQWGNVDKHGRNQTNDVTVRMMYLDWTVPGTAVKVRSGRHQLGLPEEAFGTNSILGGGYGNREGVVVTAPVTDNFGLTALWTRLGVEGTDTDMGLNDDMFAVAANLKFDGVSGSVYAAYAALDEFAALPKNNGWNGGRPAGEGDAYWAGFTSTMSFFDPFTLKLSAAYGTFEAKDSANDTDGWNVQAKASYKTAFGTPVLGAWYFSGKDSDGEGWMPNAGYFAGTNHLYDGYACLVNPSMANIDGNWAVQAGIEGVSFLSGLTHDFHVTYMKGTNDDKFAGDVFLTEEDAVVEFTLNNVYKMYKNLSVRLELAYVINDFGDATKAANGDDDDWFAGLTFDFRF